MNEIHIRGMVRTTWTYDGHLFARLSVGRENGRSSPHGPSDFVSLCFPGGADQGLTLRRGQTVTAHGWLQSRDIEEPLPQVLQRIQRQHPNGPSARIAQTLDQLDTDAPIPVRRSVNEVVVERWTVE